MIGKLKHSLKEKCPNCNNVLQLRVTDKKSMIKGVEVLTPFEFIACSHCEYTIAVKQKHRKVRAEDITLE